MWRYLIMKYLAKVKTNRNGAKLMLYLKLWFINIPIYGYGRYFNKRVWFLIDEDLEKWKKYYGKKLKVDHQFIMGVRDKSLKRYFKIDVDPQFINVKAVGEPPQLGETEINYILEDVTNLDRWRETIPPDSFEFSGFVTISATNVEHL